MVFQEQDFFIQSSPGAFEEILVLEVIVVGKGLVVFSKGLVVFITSSNCLWKSLSGKEYKQYAHNKI